LLEAAQPPDGANGEVTPDIVHLARERYALRTSPPTASDTKSSPHEFLSSVGLQNAGFQMPSRPSAFAAADRRRVLEIRIADEFHRAVGE